MCTGATGSGKTTTLAAMLNELNMHQEIHMVTLEDPIEFLHPHLKATFSQRELGRDFSDFAVGLRAALRQAPKVILVGEIRDRETMEIALTAAETGHVVFSTLHTISASQSINRVIGMFTSEEEVQVRQRLADTLRYVISQRLAPKIGGGRVLVTEIMGSNLRTRETILLGESESRNYHEIIEASLPERLAQLRAVADHALQGRADHRGYDDALQREQVGHAQGDRCREKGALSG